MKPLIRTYEDIFPLARLDWGKAYYALSGNANNVARDTFSSSAVFELRANLHYFIDKIVSNEMVLIK